MSSLEEKHKGQVDDDAQLAAMGHKAELDRNFSMLYAYSFLIMHRLAFLSGC
jgi:hypothetical protein